MKNTLLGSSLLLALFSAPSVAADDFSGSRVGGGLSKTGVTVEYDGIETWDGNYGNGFKLEYGYDFNQIIGFALSYETNNDTISYEEIEGESIKLGIDLGYAFPIQDAFIKPYGKLGFISYAEEYVSYGYRAEFDDSSVFAGLGVRFQYSHFYTDLGVDFYTLEDGPFDLYYVQSALMAGYKF